MKNFGKCGLALLLIAASVQAQNWAARMYSSVSAGDPYIVAGGPTNWPSEWVNIGTNASAVFPLVFVGNNTARSNFIAARIGPWQNWKTNTYDPQAAAAQSNFVFTITNNIASFTNLLTSNFVFLATVQTNQAAVTTLVLSNQTVTLSRLINRIGKMLTDQYHGD